MIMTACSARMTAKSLPFKISLLNSSDSEKNWLHTFFLEKNLYQLLPDCLLRRNKVDSSVFSDALIFLETSLPLISFPDTEKARNSLSYYLFCKHRINAAKFFYDMLNRWLIPGKKTNVSFFMAMDFIIEECKEDVFTIAEISINVERQEDLFAIKQHFPFLKRELRLGLTSAYHATRILEAKGFHSDEKNLLVQEGISSLLYLRPHEFDYNILSDAQYFLLNSSEDFKVHRGYRHLCRIIYVNYIFKRALVLEQESYPDKRHIHIKIFRTFLTPQGNCEERKPVLGFLICMNLIRDNEVFEGRHLSKAVTNILTAMKLIESGYLPNFSRKASQVSLYLEFEKADGTCFSSLDIPKLKERLSVECKRHIEHLVYPTFMPRNEEEIMRHIVTLSDELKYARDIPQVMIMFDQQREEDLLFTVILLRILKKDSPKLQGLFEEIETSLEFVPDRVKKVGMLRKKYPKEAHVFWICVDKLSFLRDDHSIDLYKARHFISAELAKVIGEFRDFNGGILSKESEAFEALKGALPNLEEHESFLLENFFYSLTPSLMKSILDPLALKVLFTMLLNVLEENVCEGEHYDLITAVDANFAYVSLVIDDLSFKDRLMQSVDLLDIASTHLANTLVNISDGYGLAMLYRCHCDEKKKEFLCSVKAVVQDWKSVISKTL